MGHLLRFTPFFVIGIPKYGTPGTLRLPHSELAEMESVKCKSLNYSEIQNDSRRFNPPSFCKLLIIRTFSFTGGHALWDHYTLPEEGQGQS